MALLGRNLETHLPVVPPEVSEVRFRWRTGSRRHTYHYNFYTLESHDQHLLANPTLDIPTRGRIPRKTGGGERQHTVRIFRDIVRVQNHIVTSPLGFDQLSLLSMYIIIT